MIHNHCPKCGLPLTTAAHICIHKIEKREAPRLEIIEGSEIEAEVDSSAIGLDNVFRPVFVGQDDGSSLALTIEDARRLLEFLTDAVDYIEAKNWMKN